ncbi:CubicO group peptidase (beta-lactamase class C family) [Paenibacillus cellulosilyticus]|uniref:CubicO group peptidase (Beta-lactamase class C family) n=1 Tax=Paenibacillus cellulosilyticus TaxID=375489 RepID=A0A2V2YV36_9BACL|nr:serine hydrolase domain-containing protein [Paenibacillus cellulosilyticus]PWW05092.1 CubicO group peptidase (beta-lactamase class C family) [Paenibacillus cellulosilyticus]QKS48644.1 beta-lactamase family protein [Paenibacillus cellulosilyticus]
MRKRRLFLLLLIVSLMLSMLTPVGAAAAADSGKEPLAYTDTVKTAAEKATLLTKQYGTTSVQYALIDQGKIVVSGQAGKNDAAGKKPLTADTMYGIGSTSKMFTTAAVMQLVDAGRIDLDQPVVQYISDFTMKDERYKQITPRMLLNHSAGFAGSSLQNAFLLSDNDTYAHDTFLKQLSTQVLKADPGAFSVYCNDCFSLAEILVERVSGSGFTDYIHQHFTEPLGMTNTGTPQDNLDESQMAALYVPSYRQQLPNETVNAIGTGGIYSTADDLARFSQIFTGQAADILSADAVKAMANAEYRNGLWPAEADNSIGYGLGWDSVDLFPFNDYGIQALAKGGDTVLYHASLIVLPEQNMAAAVLSSGGSSSFNQLLAAQILLQALKEQGTIDAIKPDKSYGAPVTADMPKELLDAAGHYGSSTQLLTVGVTADGQLSLTTPMDPSYPAEKYTYSSDGSFINANGSAKINLVKESNGRTYLWVRQYAQVPGLGQLAISEYAAEKLPTNEVSEETLAAWNERDGKRYYIVNEKYTSIAFLASPSAQVLLFDDVPGYVLSQRMTGPNTSVSDLQIPASGGRDNGPVQFFKQDGVEYLLTGSNLYISQDALKPIYSGKHARVTIPTNGNSKWYTIPDKAAGKTMSVKLPSAGSYAVYDENGSLVTFSVIHADDSIVLPKNGTIVFTGAAGAKFDLTLS